TGRLRALAEADLGLVEGARTAATEALETAEAMGDQEWKSLALGVLGRVELALGNVDAAAGYLRDPPAELLSRGYRDPAAPRWGDAMEALIAAAELEPARGYLEAYEESAERAESPWGRAVAARCRGLLVAREGDLAAAFVAFERSLADLEGLPYPFERGRT